VGVGPFQLIAEEGDDMVLSRRLSLLALVVLCFSTNVSASLRANDLINALKARDVALVRSLVAAGADVNEKSRGEYPLNIAAVFGPVEMVSLLIDAGADIEKPGLNGMHPLHNAVLSGHKDIIALLIKRGAAIDARDNRGNTPFLRFAASAGNDIEIAKMLLAAGADPSVEDEDRDQPLHYAAQTGNIELGKLLIATGVDINHAGVDGWSAIQAAVINSRHEFVKLLIAAGVDVNVTRGPLGKSPLSHAGNDAVMRQLLIQAGAKQ
jgi:uncharacterized protein